MFDDFEVRFSQLSPDIQVQVLEFLPISARVRFERVCKNWADLLKYVWKKQKRLVVCFANKYYDNDYCLDPSHRPTLTDIFVDQQHSFVHTQRDSFSVIRRCPNLIALYFSANQVATDHFGSDIAKYCPRLEHVSVRDATTFLAFKSFARIERSRIKCIHIDSDDQDADDDFDEEIANFARCCPRLENLLNFSNYNTFTLFELLSSQLVQLKVGSICDIVFPTLIGKGFRLKEVCVKDVLDTHSVGMILRLKKLESLELAATSVVLRLITDSDVKFKSLSLMSAECDGFTAMDLRNMLSRHGFSLRRLSVSGLKFAPEDFVMFREFCPLLTSLEVIPTDIVSVNDAGIQALCNQTQLIRLDLAVFIFNEGQLNNLLHSLTKLHEISFQNVQVTTGSMTEFLHSYATRHPNRQITAWLSYDDRPNASPPPRSLLARSERKPPGLSNINVMENLRIVYTH